MPCDAQKSDFNGQPETLAAKASPDPSKQADIKLPILMILLDGSKSMGEFLPSRMTKMDTVRASLHQSLTKIPSSTCVGLRVFGQHLTRDNYIDCQQSELLIPPSNGNRRSIFERLRHIKPTGLTPLEHSIKEIVEKDLRAFQGKKTIVLITDGSETCGGNPWEYVKTFAEQKIHVKIIIVGLGMQNNPSARRQLTRIAQCTNGNFTNVDTLDALNERLIDAFITASKDD